MNGRGDCSDASSLSVSDLKYKGDFQDMAVLWSEECRMKKPGVLLALLLINPVVCFAQASGNIGYSQSAGKSRAEQNERAKRAISKEDTPPSDKSMFIEASVLMNVRADEYVAVFGIAQTGVSLSECNRKMDATVVQFTDELKTQGIVKSDYFVDYISQNRIYGYEIAGEIAKEKLTGFELKKNISIRFKEYAQLDKLTLAASRTQIFDLIKVDYIVKDNESIQNRLMAEAARIVKLKTLRRERLLGVKMALLGQVYAEKFDVYFPSEMYDSYTAYESEEVTGNSLQKFIVQNARKSQTFFYNGLSAKGFDFVVNPVVVEPGVQYTLYLKMRFDSEPKRAVQSKKPNPGKSFGLRRRDASSTNFIPKSTG